MFIMFSLSKSSNMYFKSDIYIFTGSALWLGQYEDSTVVPFIPFESSEQFNPYFQAFIVFFTYIIIFQVNLSHLLKYFLIY
jgi:hypothetical protein